MWLGEPLFFNKFEELSDIQCGVECLAGSRLYLLPHACKLAFQVLNVTRLGVDQLDEVGARVGLISGGNGNRTEPIAGTQGGNAHRQGLEPAFPG